MSSHQRKSPAREQVGHGARQHYSKSSNPNHSVSPIDRLLPLLRNVRKAGRDQWMASAPTREDRTPSMAVHALPDGRVLIHDFAGDEPGELLAAIGLSLSDLFPDHGRHDARSVPPGQRWDFRGLLKVLRHEATVVQLCAADMARGKALSPDDRDRLRKSSLRIHKAVEVA